MNRRYFFRQLASGLIATSAPTLFIPKLIRPQWKPLPPHFHGVLERCIDIRLQVLSRELKWMLIDYQKTLSSLPSFKSLTGMIIASKLVT